MEIDYNEYFSEWQALSMEDAIWARGRKDWWRRVPKRKKKEEETITSDDVPEYGSPELPF